MMASIEGTMNGKSGNESNPRTKDAIAAGFRSRLGAGTGASAPGGGGSSSVIASPTDGGFVAAMNIPTYGTSALTEQIA